MCNNRLWARVDDPPAGRRGSQTGWKNSRTQINVKNQRQLQLLQQRHFIQFTFSSLHSVSCLFSEAMASQRDNNRIKLISNLDAAILEMGNRKSRGIWRQMEATVVLGASRLWQCKKFTGTQPFLFLNRFRFTNERF